MRLNDRRYETRMMKLLVVHRIVIVYPLRSRRMIAISRFQMCNSMYR